MAIVLAVTAFELALQPLLLLKVIIRIPLKLLGDGKVTLTKDTFDGKFHVQRSTDLGVCFWRVVVVKFCAADANFR